MTRFRVALSSLLGAYHQRSMATGISSLDVTDRSTLTPCSRDDVVEAGHAMAQSILKHPRAVMSDLGRDYQLDDEADILAFLERYPAVVPLLFDIRSNIRRFFGDDPVRLEMFYDPEWPEDEPTLVVNIQTRSASHQALDRIHQFDNEWWLGKYKDIDVPLLVTFEHVRRV